MDDCLEIRHYRQSLNTVDSRITRVLTTRIPITRQRYCDYWFHITRFFVQRAK